MRTAYGMNAAFRLNKKEQTLLRLFPHILVSVLIFSVNSQTADHCSVEFIAS